MNIGCFIDYDNLSSASQTAGVLSVITQIAQHLDHSQLSAHNRLEIRLYGGWLDHMNLTSNAVTLAAELSDQFPRVINLSGKDGGLFRIACSAELVFSLLEIPGEVLHSTYRKKVGTASVHCLNSQSIPCSHENCIADDFHLTIKKRKCSNSKCGRALNDFFYRNEQKMVDTLLSCDLHYAPSKFDLIIIVSSDDDFVPVIKTLLNRRANLMHVETLPGLNQIMNKFNLKLTSVTLN